MQWSYCSIDLRHRYVNQFVTSEYVIHCIVYCNFLCRSLMGLRIRAHVYIRDGYLKVVIYEYYLRHSQLIWEFFDDKKMVVLLFNKQLLVNVLRNWEGLAPRITHIIYKNQNPYNWDHTVSLFLHVFVAVVNLISRPLILQLIKHDDVADWLATLHGRTIGFWCAMLTL